MTELIKFKNAIDNDMNLRLQYLKVLDSLMVKGEVTPEMTSVAAKKLGFDISVDEFENESQDTELSENELENVNGGSSLFTCINCWIHDEKNLCPMGGFHEFDSPEQNICRKCHMNVQ